MPEKRKQRDYYHEESVKVGAILEKYPAILQTLGTDKALMNANVRVSDDMYQSLGLGNTKR